MYNVKRIGVWKYEAKMSRDWAPPHWDEGYIRKGWVSHQQPGTRVDIPITTGGAK
jgi:hypothetical protein